MIIYNVTINVEREVHDEWLNWMTSDHIPKIMKTGLFLNYSMLRMLSEEPGNTGITYAIQYRCNDIDDLNRYLQNFAQNFQQEHMQRYRNKHVAFRSMLEVIDEG